MSINLLELVFEAALSESDANNRTTLENDRILTTEDGRFISSMGDSAIVAALTQPAVGIVGTDAVSLTNDQLQQINHIANQSLPGLG